VVAAVVVEALAEVVLVQTHEQTKLLSSAEMTNLSTTMTHSVSFPKQTGTISGLPCAGICPTASDSPGHEREISCRKRQNRT